MEIALMARANSSRLDRDLPCNGLLAALTFAAALGMLAISLFWPYLLPFALSIEPVATPHSNLAFALLAAGAFVFPLMLLFTAINYTAVKLRPRATIIPMRSEDNQSGRRGRRNCGANEMPRMHKKGR
jgi:cytochrome d ubiquinol oxidase subunit II